MSSTRKTLEHLKSAKNLRGVAEAALAAEVATLAAEVAALVSALVAAALVAGAAAAEVVGRSERRAIRR